MSSTISIEKEILRSQAFRELSSTAKTAYFDFLMKRTLRKSKRLGWVCTNNGQIEFTYSEALKKGYTRRSFRDSLDQLIERGFIDIAHLGSGGWKNDKNLYSISDRWQHFGTDEFVPVKRPRDRRKGIGFQKKHR